MSDSGIVARAAAFLAVYGLWAVIHSLTMSRPVKDLARRLIGPGFRYYRLGFTVFALMSFGLAAAVAPRLPERVWLVQGPVVWALWLARLAAAGLFVWTFKAFDLREFIGLRQATGPEAAGLDRDGELRGSARLSVSGAYGLVRHPMYLAGVVFLFADPDMTLGKLLFAVFATAYFLLGSIHEEGRLIDLYGQAYRDYQTTTPRLIPDSRSRLGRG